MLDRVRTHEAEVLRRTEAAITRSLSDIARMRVLDEQVKLRLVASQTTLIAARETLRAATPGP